MAGASGAQANIMASGTQSRRVRPVPTHDLLGRRAVIEGGAGGRPHGPSAAALEPEQPFAGDTTAGRCYGIRAVQELLGRSDAKTTMVCIYVPNRGPSG